MSDYILGADEAGTGAWAGPFTVCAVLVPEDWSLEGLTDSKKCSEKKRERLYDEIMAQRPFISYFLEWRWPEEIEARGLRRAHIDAFECCVRAGLLVQPEADVIIDGTMPLKNVRHRTLAKADMLVQAVSAASIIAKVERDRYMRNDADSEFPAYGFHQHVGYGVAAHIEALDEHGPCRLHRLSYEPVQKRVKGLKGLPSRSPAREFLISSLQDLDAASKSRGEEEDVVLATKPDDADDGEIRVLTGVEPDYPF